jgi:2-polyprenyl-6-methoxyphenol hydroxylase-like FAD-dependent oxidoreductase
MITILGSGPAGLILERICQIKQWEHQLIGSTSPVGNKLILLTHTSINFLTQLGFHIPIHKCYTSLRIKSYTAIIPCYIRPAKTPYLCAGIWQSDLLIALQKYTQFKNTTILSGKLTPLSLESSTETFKSDYLIGCDGSNSLCAKVAQISYSKRMPYHCMVIPANIDGNTLHQQQYEKFILATIPDHQGSLILSSPYPLQHLKISVSSLNKILPKSVHINSIKKPYFHTIIPKMANHSFYNKTLLLGNAALTIEPITASGLNHTIFQLKQIVKFNDINSIEAKSKELYEQNKILFSQIPLITAPDTITKLKQKIGFYSQLVSPIFQDYIHHMGNPDE